MAGGASLPSHLSCRYCISGVTGLLPFSSVGGWAEFVAVLGARCASLSSFFTNSRNSASAAQVAADMSPSCSEDAQGATMALSSRAVKLEVTFVQGPLLGVLFAGLLRHFLIWRVLDAAAELHAAFAHEIVPIELGPEFVHL